MRLGRDNLTCRQQLKRIGGGYLAVLAAVLYEVLYLRPSQQATVGSAEAGVEEAAEA